MAAKFRKSSIQPGIDHPKHLRVQSLPLVVIINFHSNNPTILIPFENILQLPIERIKKDNSTHEKS